MKQLELWPVDRSSKRNSTPEIQDIPSDKVQDDPRSDLTKLAIPLVDVAELAAAPRKVDGPPIPAPLQIAVEAGVFGLDLDGPIVPDREQIETLTYEHANELIILLADSQVLEDAIRLEYDPATGRTPPAPEARQSLLARLDKEWKKLLQAYDDAIGAYGDGFGEAAVEALDKWVRKTLADGDQKPEPYPPSHPWHYFHAGDNAPPVPVEEIPADPDASRWLSERLPKNPKKRSQVLHDMLEREQASLEADKARYADIVKRGAEALSRFDREIAHTSDAMAVATALALKYRHVSLGLGRVAWLMSQLPHVPIAFPSS